MDEITTIEAVVEIPRGSRNKYEFEHATGSIRLDRVLYSSVHYPTDYGFIPNTRSADGDPLDVLIIVEEPTFPGCRVRIRPIGVLLMRDEKGLDEKILAVPLADPRFDGIRDIAEIHEHWLAEIKNFFATYKMLEGKDTHVEGWRGAPDAWVVLRRCGFAQDTGDTVQQAGEGSFPASDPPARTPITRVGPPKSSDAGEAQVTGKAGTRCATKS